MELKLFAINLISALANIVKLTSDVYFKRVGFDVLVIIKALFCKNAWREEHEYEKLGDSSTNNMSVSHLT